MGAGWVLLPCPGSISLPRVSSSASSPSPGSHPSSLGLLLRRRGPSGGTPCPGQRVGPRCLFLTLFPGCHGRVPLSIVVAPQPVPLETHPGAEARGILSRCSPFNPPLSGDRAGLVPGTGSPARHSGCWGGGEGTPSPSPPVPAAPPAHGPHGCPSAWDRVAWARGGASAAELMWVPRRAWGAPKWAPLGAPAASLGHPALP